MDPKGFVIAIDGPSASGKGTIAKKLAKELNGFYLYTGAMYRSIALLCINKGLDLGDEKTVESVLPDLNINLANDQVFLNGEDVTERLRQPDTASGASIVGVYPKIREASVIKQQEIGKEEIEKGKIVVIEGRDSGTVVFPDALLKVFLTARPEVRARRRMEQYGKLSEEDLKNELIDLKTRDTRDTMRKISPLPDNPENLGYFVLDNSDISEEETVNTLINELKSRKLI